MDASPNPLAAIFHAFRAHTTVQPAEVAPRLPAIHGIQAVLFDIYGTLFSSAAGDISLQDTAAATAPDAALHDALAACKFTVPADFPSAPHARFVSHIRAHQAAARAEGAPHPEVDIRAVWADFLADCGLIPPSSLPPDQVIAQLAVAFEARVNPVCRMPGCLECLGTLRQRGLLLGIVSNAQFFTPLLFDAFCGAPFAALGFSPDLCEFSFAHLRAKPDTFLYALCRDQLSELYGIAPQAVLYVGNDRRNDVWPAQRVGFRTALFAGDTRSFRPRPDAPELADVEPDAILTHLDQLPALLAS